MIKNKIMCILLTVSIIFGATVTAAAAETETNVDDLQTLIDLGFVNKDAKAENYVTRAEFADTAVKLRNAGAVTDNSLVYSDLNKNNKYYKSVMEAAGLGIISGNGEGTISPDDVITSEQMRIMLLRVLGYVGISENELNNVSGLLPTVNFYSGVRQITWAMASKTIFDIFKVETVNKTIGSDQISFLKTGKNILEDYHDIYTYTGVVRSVGEICITGDITAPERRVRVDDGSYICDDERMIKYIGRRVKIYYSDDDNEILSVREYNNSVLTIYAEDIDSFKNNKLSYYDGEKLKSARTSINLDVLYNYRCDTRFDESDFKIENGYITLVDNDDDGIYDFADIKAAQTVVVGNTDIENETVYFKYKINNMITAKPDDIFTTRGEIADIREIMQGDILSLYISKDGKYTKAVICTDIVQGEIESVSEEGNGNKSVVIDGKSYKVLKSCADNQSTYIKAGAAASFCMDEDNNIVYIKDIENAMQYGYVVNVSYDVGKDELAFKLLKEDNTFAALKASGKTVYNGTRIAGKSKLWQGIGEKSFRHRLIRFRTNINNEVTEIQTAENAGGEDSLAMYYTDYSYDTGKPVKKNDNLKHFYKSDSNIIANRVHTDSNTVVMVVPNDESETREEYYLASDISYFKNDFEYKVEAYNTRRDDYTAAAIVIYDDVSSDYSVDDQNTGISILQSVYKTVNSDNDETDGIVVWTNGTKFRYPLKDSEVIKKVYGEYVPTKGDIVRYLLKNGEINKLELIYSAEKDLITAPSSVTHKNDNNHYTQFRVWDAYVFFKWGSNLMLTDRMPTEYENYNYGDYEIHSCATSSVTVCETGNDNNIYIGDADSIIGYKNTFGAECSRVIVYERYGEGMSIVVYK